MVISTYLSLPFNSSNNKVNTHFIIKSVYVNILVLFYYVSRFEIFLESQFPKRTLTQSYPVIYLYFGMFLPVPSVWKFRMCTK